VGLRRERRAGWRQLVTDVGTSGRGVPVLAVPKKGPAGLFPFSEPEAKIL